MHSVCGFARITRKENKMKTILAALMMTAAAASASACGLQIKDGWARATVEGMNMSGAFMVIHNGNKTDDRLTGGSSPVAERVEIHTHINDNGVMRMREVEGGLALPASARTELKPGSYHIMFMGLKQALKEGETVPVTLTFKHAKPQTINFTVRTAPKAAASTHQHHGGTHHHH